MGLQALASIYHIGASRSRQRYYYNWPGSFSVVHIWLTVIIVRRLIDWKIGNVAMNVGVVLYSGNMFFYVNWDENSIVLSLSIMGISIRACYIFTVISPHRHDMTTTSAHCPYYLSLHTFIVGLQNFPFIVIRYLFTMSFGGSTNKMNINEMNEQAEYWMRCGRIFSVNLIFCAGISVDGVKGKCNVASGFMSHRQQ